LELSRHWATTLRRRGLLRAGAAGLAGGAIAGCGRGAKAPAQVTAPSRPIQGGTLANYLAVNPPTLDSQATKSIPGRSAAGHVLSRLYAHKTGPEPSIASSLDVEPDLATSAESSDAVTWTVKLRADARFQNIAPVNGHPVEAEDVKATFARAFALPASAAKAYVWMIEPNQIETPDKQTVIFKLKYPYGPFLATLANLVGSFIYPREVLSGSYDPAKLLIGSGPFTLENFTPDVSLTYKRNTDWFQEGRPYIDGSRAAVIPDAAQQLAQFTAGNLDILAVGQNDLDAARRSNPKAAVVTAPSGNPYQIFGHMDDPTSPFRDLRLRQAISMAIDRAAVSKTMFSGASHDNAVISSAKGKWALSPDQLGDASQFYTYNPDAARKLVAASGAADQIHKFVWPLHFPGPEIDTLAQMIVPMLNAAGFKIQLSPVDYATQWQPVDKGVLYGHYPNDTIAFLSWMSASNTAEEELFSTLGTGGSANHSAASDPDVDSMLSKMLSLTDEQERLKAAADVQRFVAGKMYYIAAIPTGNIYTLVQARVRDYAYSLGADSVGTETEAKLWLAA